MLTIPDPHKCTHEPKWHTCDYACYDCLTVYEDARWPAMAVCEANADRLSRDIVALRAEMADVKVERDEAIADRDRYLTRACVAENRARWVPVGERLPALDRNVPLWTDRGLMFGSRGLVTVDEWLWADQYGDCEVFADVTVLQWLDLQPPEVQP